MGPEWVRELSFFGSVDYLTATNPSSLVPPHCPYNEAPRPGIKVCGGRLDELVTKGLLLLPEQEITAGTREGARKGPDAWRTYVEVGPH